VRLEALGKLKNSMTASGIEPATLHLRKESHVLVEYIGSCMGSAAGLNPVDKRLSLPRIESRFLGLRKHGLVTLLARLLLTVQCVFHKMQALICCTN
jgi:hypothetical protein